jgi:hypothetical protein
MARSAEGLRVGETLVLWRFSWGESDRIAWEIVSRIREGVLSLGKKSRTLKHIAKVFNVKLCWERSGEEPGGYLPPLNDGGEGTILISPKLAPHRKWRVFVHELAHHLMHEWVAGACYSAAKVALAGNPDCALLRHAIARRVEQLLAEL